MSWQQFQGTVSAVGRCVRACSGGGGGGGG